MLLGHACAALSKASARRTSAYTARLLYLEASRRSSVTSAACWIQVLGSKLKPGAGAAVPAKLPVFPAVELKVAPAVLAGVVMRSEAEAIPVRLLLLFVARSACCCFCCRVPVVLACWDGEPSAVLLARLPGKLLLVACKLVESTALDL